MPKSHTPEAFDFVQPSTWPMWKRFPYLQIATNLDKENQDVQVNSLLYAMDRDAAPVFSTFHFTEQQEVNYFDTVIAKSD